MRVAILGAGAGGAAAVAELSQAGHELTLWNRSATTLAPFVERGGVEFEGVLGEGFAKPALITADLAQAIRRAEVALVCLPTISHAAVARALAEVRAHTTPVVLNPGHTGGALEFREAYRQASGGPAPPIAEFHTLSYIARKYQPQRVTISGKGKFLRLGALPGGAAASHAARSLYPVAQPVPDVLNSSLANLNMTLHAPGAVLGAAWVEATRGDFTFYVQGMTPGVIRVMQALDAERLAVARAFGHELLPLGAEMQKYGTVEATVKDPNDLVVAISGGEMNQRLKAPDSLTHRYYLEDFGHGLVPFIALAKAAAVATPTASALLELGIGLTGIDFRSQGRTAETMGIAGLDREQLLRLVRGQ